MPTNAAIYCRISRDVEKQGLGVARQQAECEALAAAKGWTVVDVYVDNDISAARKDGETKPRPDYERMLEAIKGQEIDAVVCWDQDRGWRDPMELETFFIVCERVGMHLVATVAGDVNISTGEGMLIARIKAAVAAEEIRKLRARVRSKARELALAGKLGGGGTRPFGFNDDRVTIREDEGLLIKEAARRVIAGDSLRSICTDWQNDGIPTPGGKRWATQVLRRLLCSARIAGLREHRGAVVAVAEWPAIIDVETRNEVVAVLTNPFRDKRRITSRSYLLTGGLAVCGLCGTKLVARPRGDKRQAYVCATGINFDGCGKIGRLADPVHTLIRDAVLYRLDGDGLLEALRASSGEDTQAKALVDTLTALEGRLRRLNTEYAQGDLWTEEEFKEQKTGLREQIASTKDALDRRSNHRVLSTLPSGDLAEWWETASNDRRRALVAMFVDRVVFHPCLKGSRKFDPSKIEVVWKG